jgi:hypothetical protein|tara:strand:- start:179 stop:508 length:330 start_codon:yes stop_codon:yes gene_type:complete
MTLKHNFRHKYNVSPKGDRTRNGIVFDSKKEMHYYDGLQLLKQSGEVLFFLRQVPFHLAGGTRYLCDFCVFYTNGVVRFVDVKGFKTQTYLAKKKQVEDLYRPVEIEEI